MYAYNSLKKNVDDHTKRSYHYFSRMDGICRCFSLDHYIVYIVSMGLLPSPDLC